MGEQEFTKCVYYLKGNIMCGIIGVASSEGFKEFAKRRNFFFDGLYADALRGMHSTGVLAVPTKYEDEIIIHKKAMPSYDFLETRSADNIIKDIDKYKYVVGHNRHATKGGISSRMAHPFNHGDISLVHNGTLNTQYYLPKGSTFTSDSEAITYAINEQGSEETIKELDGAFALVWHNNNSDTLHMVRNDERPLSFGFVKGVNTMLFASEKRMLDWIALRNGLIMDKVYDLNKGHEIIFDSENLKEFEFIKHTLKSPKVYYNDNFYSNKGSHNTGSSKNNANTIAKKKLKVFEEFKITAGRRYDIEVTKFVPYNSHQTTGTIFGYLDGRLSGKQKFHSVQITGVREDEWAWLCESEKGEKRYVNAQLTQSCQSSKTSGKYPVFTAIKPEISDLNTFMTPSEEGDKDLPRFQGPQNHPLTSKEFDGLVEDGCCHCTGVIFPEEHEAVGWTANGEPICPICVNDPNLGITIH